MESQLGSFGLGPGDNKGILSLLTAIEQSEDNFDPDSNPSPEKLNQRPGVLSDSSFSHQSLAAFHLGGLEGDEEEDEDEQTLTTNEIITLEKIPSCLICAKPPAMEADSDSLNMVDIFSEINSFASEERCCRTIANLLEDILARRLDPARHSNLICIDCCEIVQIIEKLDAQVIEYKDLIKKRFEESSMPPSSRSSDGVPSSAHYPDYADPVLDLKMPLHFLDTSSSGVAKGDDEAGSVMSPAAKKSKLQILAETLEEAEMEGMVVAALQMEDDDEEEVEKGEDRTAATVAKNDPPPFCCGICSRTFKQVVMLKKHMKVHNGRSEGNKSADKKLQQQHSCEECHKFFPTRALLQTHLRSHSTLKPFKCASCCKDFKSKHSLSEHVLLKHKGEKVFGCSVCGEQFNSKHMRAVHERLHKGERGLVCEECGDSFQTSQSLAHHKSRHTGDFQFHCQVCAKGFNNFKLLEEHEHIHTGNKPYACKQCDKSFANRGSLWVHNRRHEVGSKPYACQYCPKAFSHSSHLNVHKRIHTGEKPYRCRFCPSGFISGNHLKRHMRAHKDQLPFACALCKMAFGKRSELVQHGNKMHAGNVVDDVLSAASSAAADMTPAGGDGGDSCSSSLPVVITPCNSNRTVIKASIPVDDFEDHNSEKENKFYLIEDADGKVFLNKQQSISTAAATAVVPLSGGNSVDVADTGPVREDYILPVSLLEGDGSVVMESMLGNQTIVLIQVPHGGQPD